MNPQEKLKEIELHLGHIKGVEWLIARVKKLESEFEYAIELLDSYNLHTTRFIKALAGTEDDSE